MKKKKDEILRVETVINSDRLRLKDDFIRLLEKDLSKILGEYFYLENIPEIEIVKEGKGFKVNVVFSSSGIKNFINVP